MKEMMVDFATELYGEHIEESSCLYEQRLSLLDDLEIPRVTVADFEQRFEAHIDGLVVGEDLALDVCRQQATEGDFGELHAAVRVFCRQKRLDLMKEVLEKLDPQDQERVHALSDALNHELPGEWESEFIKMLAADDGKLIPIISTLIGYRRLNAGAELRQALDKHPAASATIIWSLGRIREKQSRTVLLNRYLQTEDESTQSAAALALLRIGDPQTVQHCHRAAKSHTWPHLPLGLGGGRSEVSILKDFAASPKVAPLTLLSLGLLGDASAIQSLMPHLANPDLAPIAALGLNLITGAEIYEEVFIPEEVDEDELFDEEKEKLKRGESLIPPGQRPPGTTINRLSQKPDDWKKWWVQNKPRFNAQVRYRNGTPYSPASLIENLESERSPRQVRQLAYEELVIRYGIDFPFETDMFVVHQRQALDKYTQWTKSNAGRFREGRWYLAGQITT